MPVKAPIYLKPGRTSKGKKSARLRDILSGDMISPPLGDFRHVAHVGSSGGMGEGAAAFGDLSFLWSSERPASHAGDGVLQRDERRRAVPEARRDRDLEARVASCPGYQAARGATCAAAIPSPVLRNAFVLPYTGPEQALVLPGVSPFCPGRAAPPRRRPEPSADSVGGAGDDANGRENVAGAGTSRSTGGGVVRAVASRSPFPLRSASPPRRVNRLACPDAKGPCTSPSPKRGLLRSIRDQVQNITLSPPLSRSRNFQSVHASETSSQEPLLLSSNDMHREEEEEEGDEGSSRAFRFMSFSGNGFSHRRLTGVTASSGKPQQPKATARAAAAAAAAACGQLSPGPESRNPRPPSREGCARNGFASAVDHEQPGCLWPRTPERVAVTESMHFLKSRQTLHPRSKRRDLLAKSRRENGDEHRRATPLDPPAAAPAAAAAAACPSLRSADDPWPGAWPDNSKSPPTPSPSVSPSPPPPPPPPPPQRSQRGDPQARGAGGRGEWAAFSTLSRTRWPPGEPHCSDSLLSLHTDLGPSMLDDVLGVMERQEGRGQWRASVRYATPDGTRGKGAAAAAAATGGGGGGGSGHGGRGAERDSGVACEASASAENLLRHFSLK